MTSRQQTNLSLYAATLFAALSAIKVYAPDLTLWVLTALAMGIAAWPLRQQIGDALRQLDYRIFVPWLVFVLAIIAAATLNELTAADRIFAAVTVAKFGVIAGCMALLICMRLDRLTLERALMIAMILAALGFAVATVVPNGLLRLGDGRIGWVAAWPGIFWKIGVFALPFLVWRVVTAQPWSLLPALTLALLITAIDGSRTGLLAAIAVIVASLAIALLYARSAVLPRGIVISIFAGAVSYLCLQPAIATGIAKGGIEGWGVALGMLILTIAAALSLLATYGPATPARQKLRLSLAAMALLACTILGSVGYLGGHLLAGSTLASGSTPTGVISENLDIVALDRLAQRDNVRMEMISAAIDGAVAHFPLGGGLGTTKADDNGTEVHVHMTYLQLLSDIGIIGLVAYLAIFATLLWWFIRLDGPTRLYAVPVMAVPAVHLLQGMFAPLSNEISEWWPVIMAAAVLYGLAYGHRSATDEVGVR